MDGLMDRWMDGWIDRWIDAWIVYNGIVNNTRLLGRQSSNLCQSINQSIHILIF